MTQFCRAAESSSDTNSLSSPPPRKFKKGEIRAFFSVGDPPSEANSSPVEGHCQSSRLAYLIAVLAAGHVDSSGGGPKVFEGLIELLNDFADRLGLSAHTLPLLELCPSSK